MRTTRYFFLGLLLLISLRASADPVTLNFEGLRDLEQVLNFYNGGTGSLGSSGPNYGISFSSSAFALIDQDNGGSGNFANEPSSSTVLYAPNEVMNVYGGFNTALTFFYASQFPSSVTVYDGFNGLGNVLGTIGLNANGPFGDCTGDPQGDFCRWDPVNLTFAGTAYSVTFAGVGIDDVVLGNSPSAVPEPISFVMLGSGLVIAAGLRRKSRK